MYSQTEATLKCLRHHGDDARTATILKLIYIFLKIFTNLWIILFSTYESARTIFSYLGSVQLVIFLVHRFGLTLFIFHSWTI